MHNKIPLIMETCGVLVIALGIVGSMLIHNDTNNMLLFIICIASSLITGILLLGLAEIIKLLHVKIFYQQKTLDAIKSHMVADEDKGEDVSE